MRYWFLNLCAMTALSQAVFNGVRVLVSYKALELGGDAFSIGIITALFALAPLASAMMIGRSVDRHHAAAHLRIGLVIIALATLAITLGTSLIALGVGFILLGFAQTQATIAGQGFATILSKPADLDRTFAGMTLAISFGQSIGIMLAGVIVTAAPASSAYVETTPALLAMVALALIAVPFGAVLRQSAPSTDSDAPPPRQSSAVSLLRMQGMKPAILSSLMVLVSVDLLTAYLPVLGQEYGLSPLLVTTLLTVRAISSMVSRFFLPMLLRHVNRSRMLIAGTLCSAIPMAIIPLAPNPVVIGLLLAIAGFFWGIGQPLTMVWVIRLVPNSHRTTALALRLMGNRIGQVAVPLGAGVVAGAAGGGSVFVLTGGLLGIAALSTWRSVRRLPASEADYVEPSPEG